MEFNEFRKMICDKVNERLDDGYRIMEYDGESINGIVKQGIRVKNDKNNIGTVCYLKQFYEDFEEGLLSEDEIMESLMCMVECDKNAAELEEDIKWTTDWERVKTYVKVRLVNTEKNKEMLEKRPHIKIEDLSAVFSIELFAENDIFAGITVNKEVMEAWGQNEESLLEQAVANMDKEGFRLINIRTEKDIDNIFEKETAKKNKVPQGEIYALTGKRVVYGAAVIVSPFVRKTIAECFKNGVYILPSSVHEFMLVPKGTEIKVPELKRLVRVGNATTIEPEEYLGENIYELDENYQLKYAI